MRSFIALKASEQLEERRRLCLDGGGGAWGFRVRAYGVWGGGCWAGIYG